MRKTIGIILAVMLLASGSIAGQEGFDPEENVRDSDVDTTVCPMESSTLRRIEKLREEIENPSPEAMGLKGNVVDTYYFQAQMAHGLAIGNRDTIRRILSETPEGLLRDWLVVALGIKGDSSMASEIERVLIHSPHPDMRQKAVRSLARTRHKPLIPAAIFLLQDTRGFVSQVPFSGKSALAYPVRREAAEKLKIVGVKLTGERDILGEEDLPEWTPAATWKVDDISAALTLAGLVPEDTPDAKPGTRDCSRHRQARHLTIHWYGLLMFLWVWSHHSMSKRGRPP